MTEIAVDRNALLCAGEGFRMTEPHPKGYILSQAQQMNRAIYAYEWAKANMKDAGGGYVEIPSRNEIQRAVLEYEAQDH